MIYFITVMLSLIRTFQGVASEAVQSNIGHLKNGRPPNAGVSSFPVIPIAQLFAVGVVCLVQCAIGQYVVILVLGHFAVMTTVWYQDLIRLVAQFKKMSREAMLPNSPDPANTSRGLKPTPAENENPAATGSGIDC